MRGARMGKYDFRIDGIDVRTAHGKVLGRVPEGSTVLECGCATGYMTRYMVDRLGCAVYVVEIDADAFREAMRYAKDGWRGDLDGAAWHEWLDGVGLRFDRILFADVLEHLRHPQEALTGAAGLLKEDGRIIVSVPNVCHNDIILKMIEDRWDYTRYGLLDDTHIRFWGCGNMTEFFGAAGLKVESADMVTINTGQTEQWQGKFTERQRRNADFLKMVHPTGEIYQYVYTLRRAER